jgi:hypothetical protein
MQPVLIGAETWGPGLVNLAAAQAVGAARG